MPSKCRAHFPAPSPDHTITQAVHARRSKPVLGRAAACVRSRLSIHQADVTTVVGFVMGEARIRSRLSMLLGYPVYRHRL